MQHQNSKSLKTFIQSLERTASFLLCTFLFQRCQATIFRFADGELNPVYLNSSNWHDEKGKQKHTTLTCSFILAFRSSPLRFEKISFPSSFAWLIVCSLYAFPGWKYRLRIKGEPSNVGKTSARQSWKQEWFHYTPIIYKCKWCKLSHLYTGHWAEHLTIFSSNAGRRIRAVWVTIRC